MPLTASNAAVHPDDTIVALSSVAGPAKRAIIRVSGPGTSIAVNTVFKASDESKDTPRQTRRLVPGALRLTGVYSPLPASLYFFKGPKTYTGQDLAELHTIGSPPLIEQLITDLLNAGARPARSGEFTMRAFLAGKKDLAQAEAVNAVIEAGTDADLHTALTQLAGGVTQPLHVLREDLLNLLADLEAALDFTDEDIEFVGQSETLARIEAALSQLTALQKQLDDRTVSGRPIRVALVGLPNVGKSSLFNVLATSNAIVSPMPGTTRDYLSKRIEFGGATVELIDTAGWQVAEGTIAEQSQRLGREQADRADVVLWCVETGTEFGHADAALLMATGANVIRVCTKSDLFCNESGVRNQETGHEKQPITVSVMSSSGTNALRCALTEVIALIARSPLAPSQSRCRHHVAVCLTELKEARESVVVNDPPELTAASLRVAIDQLGEMTGAVYTNDLLDRIFSRFCIGK